MLSLLSSSLNHLIVVAVVAAVESHRQSTPSSSHLEVGRRKMTAR
jgi:hypothetical protein